MQESTINRIRESRIPVTIGKYTYKVEQYTGRILRCKTCDIGREWIDSEGNHITAWEVVHD